MRIVLKTLRDFSGDRMIEKSSSRDLRVNMSLSTTSRELERKVPNNNSYELDEQKNWSLVVCGKWDLDPYNIFLEVLKQCLLVFM